MDLDLESNLFISNPIDSIEGRSPIDSGTITILLPSKLRSVSEFKLDITFGNIFK